MPTPEQQAANDFRQSLVTLAGFTREPEPSVVEELSQQFRAALLLFGSDSDDNRSCAESLEIGRLTDPGQENATGFGLRLRDITTSVASVLWHAEGCPIPDSLAEALPELSPTQWDACLRLATLVLSAFECRIAPSAG